MQLRYLKTKLQAVAVITVVATAAHADAPNVEFIAGIIGDPFYTSMECGARDAAKEFNVALTWTGPTDWDIAKQQPFIDAAVQNAPDGLIMAPTDARALISQVEELVQGGLPVLTVDVPLEEAVEVQNISSNQYAGGAAAAVAMERVAGFEASFVALGLRPGMPDIDARVNGFTENFGGADKGTNILATLYPETSTTKASELVSATILANPDLKGIYATHFAAATGAAAAILQAGRQGDIKLVAFDAGPQQVRDLRDGVYDALIAQEPYTMGYDSVRLISQLISGEVAIGDVDQSVKTEAVVATRANMDDPEVSKYFYVVSCER